jgi:hypothetical protein
VSWVARIPGGVYEQTGKITEGAIILYFTSALSKALPRPHPASFIPFVKFFAVRKSSTGCARHNPQQPLFKRRIDADQREPRKYLPNTFTRNSTDAIDKDERSRLAFDLRDAEVCDGIHTAFRPEFVRHGPEIGIGRFQS